MKNYASMHGAPIARRVLLVDDDVDSAWALGQLLAAELDCQVSVASDGAQAVDLASDLRPQVVLMDISMPRIDGIEAARLLRRLFAPADMPWLVAMTGDAADGNRQRILQSGFDRYLTKPIEFDALLAALAIPAVRGVRSA